MATEKKSLKLVYIDDDQNMLEMYGQGYKTAGFEVALAMSGEEGLKIVKQVIPDMVVTDILMEDMDGFAVIEKLKKDKETSAIPVIALSNLGNNEDKAEALRLGAIAFLVKENFTPAELNAELIRLSNNQ